ncbi:putative matrilysin [Helianthus debilis subsp. tardiflorus]
MASKLTSFLPFLLVLFYLISLSKAKFDIDTIKSLQGCHKGSKVQGLHGLKLYLARYGYLSYQHTPNHINDEDDEFDQELETALKSYQNFYHLNASGTLDGPTVSQMIMPRCGQPDMNHIHGKKLLNIVSHYSFFPGSPRWDKSHLTYAFGQNYPNAYIPPVVRAFNAWASASSYFTFSRVGSTTGADLKITFENGDHGDGADFNGDVLAHAFAPRDGRFHYNANHNWAVGPGPVSGAFDLETVAVHEIGHLLGLRHSQDPNAVMFSTITIGKQVAAVLPGVVTQVHEVYNNNNNNNAPCNFKSFNSAKPLKFSGSQGASALLQWFESIENTFRHVQCLNAREVEFASSVFEKRALTWWNGIMRDRGAEVALAQTWDELQALMMKEFCPRHEIRALEREFDDLKQDGAEHRAYTDRFEELSLLCPTMVTPLEKAIERYIDCLPDSMLDIVTAVKPTTLRQAIELSATLTES